MRHISYVVSALVSALVLAAPAKAQLVNGLNSINNPLPEFPIGAKGGGSAASLAAPGGLDAVKGALQNDWEWRHGRMMGRGDQIDASNSKFLAQAAGKTESKRLAQANQ